MLAKFFLKIKGAMNLCSLLDIFFSMNYVLYAFIKTLLHCILYWYIQYSYVLPPGGFLKSKGVAKINVHSSTIVYMLNKQSIHAMISKI